MSRAVKQSSFQPQFSKKSQDSLVLVHLGVGMKMTQDKSCSRSFWAQKLGNCPFSTIPNAGSLFCKERKKRRFLPSGHQAWVRGKVVIKRKRREGLHASLCIWMLRLPAPFTLSQDSCSTAWPSKDNRRIFSEDSDQLRRTDLNPVELKLPKKSSTSTHTHMWHP